MQPIAVDFGAIKEKARSVTALTLGVV